MSENGNLRVFQISNKQGESVDRVVAERYEHGDYGVVNFFVGERVTASLGANVVAASIIQDMGASARQEVPAGG